MKRCIFCLVVALIAWIDPCFALREQLNMGDVPQVMDRLFQLHIENKDWNVTLIRRSLKLYIEYFDSEKVYLLEKEVTDYLGISDAKADEILKRVQRKDYSDFVRLNQQMEKAILRAREIRVQVEQEVIEQKGDFASFSSDGSSRYPRTLAEIALRQKERIVRFYLYHEGRARLDSAGRKEKVCVLFEKKLRRIENLYLFQEADGTKFSEDRIQHLFALRMLKAFAKSLDTHTSFFSPEEAMEMRLGLEKQFEGVGVILSEGVDGVVIADLVRGGPAEKSGMIQVNDTLVEIDGKTVLHATFEEVLDLLKKKDRSEIILGFKRVAPDKEMFFRVSLVKQPIVMKEDRIRSSYEVVEGGVIGKITLHSFYENGDGISSERDMKEAIRSFRRAGNLKGVVLDLRENSGGFLGQAVRVAGLFLNNGIVVISKYGKGDIHYLRNITSKKYFDGPVVVLTSKMSASASEIVAQALQDYGVALIVGDTRTFGKGSIQYQTITDENADLFFKVTVGKYYTVSGRSAQIEGVKADIVVPSHYAPYKIGERYLEYPLPADQVTPAYMDPLSDLDEKSKTLFRKRYLPELQKVVSIWQQALSSLKERSAQRIKANEHFQVFLRKLEKIQARQLPNMVNTIDERVDTGGRDLQMEEAVYILRDMIHLQSETSPQEEQALLMTGSD